MYVHHAHVHVVGMLQDFSNSLDCKDLCIIKKLYTSSFEKISDSSLCDETLQSYDFSKWRISRKFAPYISMDMRNFFVTGF